MWDAGVVKGSASRRCRQTESNRESKRGEAEEVSSSCQAMRGYPGVLRGVCKPGQRGRLSGTAVWRGAASTAGPSQRVTRSGVDSICSAVCNPMADTQSEAGRLLKQSQSQTRVQRSPWLDCTSAGCPEQNNQAVCIRLLPIIGMCKESASARSAARRVQRLPTGVLAGRALRPLHQWSSHVNLVSVCLSPSAECERRCTVRSDETARSTGY
jgi:hypothetical protein